MPVRLSSRDLFPGPNAVATHRFVDRQLSALAAGEDASLVRPRHALMAMGPGAKPRGDSGVREALREPDRDAGQDGAHTASGSNSCTTSKASSSGRSEEHPSELQSLMRISYAVFCLKKKQQ